ncbi:MAG: hypothetical protein U5O16_14045 [Rhodococcus sp. (in: high G+C Gram-positive bacteria)]|uniref:hypothetical protein n=1 Tax=Rhodococcus sp. TaxID=1831 RepID=UPI002ADA080B|nr:hypothetical protein [Rhodococcus sp. (in: high G+C Gram-positive bacteria)]
MSATPEYIVQLEANSNTLRENNTRITDEWLKSMTNGEDIDNSEVERGGFPIAPKLGITLRKKPFVDEIAG